MEKLYQNGFITSSAHRWLQRIFFAPTSVPVFPSFSFFAIVDNTRKEEIMANRFWLYIGFSLATLCVNAESSLLNWMQEDYEAIPPQFYSLPKGTVATASGHWGNNTPQLAIDGNRDAGSHWACEKLPATLSLEFPAPQQIRQAHATFYYGDHRVYRFYVETSLDGKEWKKVADWTQNKRPATADGFQIDFSPAGAAKWVRFTVTDSSYRSAGAHIVDLAFTAQPTLPVTAGFHGRVTTLDRVTAQNAIGDEQEKTWRASAWRNERVHGQFTLWASKSIPQLRLSVSDLFQEEGGRIPASAVQARFVRYVLAKEKSVADILDTAKSVDLPAFGFRPVWLTVNVPKATPPGIYRGELTVTGAGRNTLRFPLELSVLKPVLPSPRDWNLYLDLWQHPWAVARYHGVEPFSPLHYQLLKPIYQELAQAGQRVLTTTITELPWNHQNFDGYGTMIEHIRQADGSWKADYSLFDEYVAFGKRCGIGPQIHCYTMATWGNRIFYRDGPTGDRVAVTLVPGTPEHEKFWGAFLTDFKKHLKSKGWFDDCYIALDERSREELQASVNCLKKYAPGMKIAMAGNHAPSTFKGIEIDTYSQSIGHVDDAFLKEAQARKKEGKITTFYVCCGPHRPNTFTSSPAAEQVWLGYYLAASKLDGFLRWAFVNWPRNPLFSSNYARWSYAPGDTFFLYPGPRMSTRWELLRDGFEESEKILWLRKNGANMKAIDEILATYDFRKNVKESDEAIRNQVLQSRAAVESASRAIR